MADEAADAYLRRGDARAALEACVSCQRWGTAARIAGLTSRGVQQWHTARVGNLRVGPQEAARMRELLNQRAAELVGTGRRLEASLIPKSLIPILSIYVPRTPFRPRVFIRMCIITGLFSSSRFAQPGDRAPPLDWRARRGCETPRGDRSRGWGWGLWAPIGGQEALRRRGPLNATDGCGSAPGGCFER